MPGVCCGLNIFILTARGHRPCCHVSEGYDSLHKQASVWLSAMLHGSLISCSGWRLIRRGCAPCLRSLIDLIPNFAPICFRDESLLAARDGRFKSRERETATEMGITTLDPRYQTTNKERKPCRQGPIHRSNTEEKPWRSRICVCGS